jgi:hypothetical protein
MRLTIFVASKIIGLIVIVNVPSSPMYGRSLPPLKREERKAERHKDKNKKDKKTKKQKYKQTKREQKERKKKREREI